MLKIEGFSSEEEEFLRNLSLVTGSLFKKEGLVYYDDESGMKPFTIDFLKGDIIYRLKTSGKKQPLLKALDIRKNERILDATAGLGRDALTMAYHGCRVTAVEKNPLLFLMLKHSYDQLKQDLLFSSFKGSVEFVYGDSKEFIEESPIVWDATYFDPMYPQEEKTSKSKKDVQFLKKIGNPTENLESLLLIASKKSRDRVVLKRPPQSIKIGDPTSSILSQLVRFDVYIKSRIQ